MKETCFFSPSWFRIASGVKVGICKRCIEAAEKFLKGRITYARDGTTERLVVVSLILLFSFHYYFLFSFFAPGLTPSSRSRLPTKRALFWIRNSRSPAPHDPPLSRRYPEFSVKQDYTRVRCCLVRLTLLFLSVFLSRRVRVQNMGALAKRLRIIWSFSYRHDPYTPVFIYEPRVLADSSWVEMRERKEDIVSDEEFCHACQQWRKRNCSFYGD